MGDILEIYQQLQQKLQRDDLILPDVITCKDIAIRKLNIMKDNPYPGRREASLAEASEENEAAPERGKFKLILILLYWFNSLFAILTEGKRLHHFVTTKYRSKTAIRQEVVESAINFLNARLDTEQNDLLNSIKALMQSSTIASFIASGKMIPGL